MKHILLSTLSGAIALAMAGCSTLSGVEWSIHFDGSDVTMDGVSLTTTHQASVTITRSGTYTFDGTSTAGQIIVNAPDATVNIILDGVDLQHETSAPLIVLDAAQVTIQLLGANTLSDAAEYSLQDDQAIQSPIYSLIPLTIIGSDGSSLAIDAQTNDAIKTIGDLTLSWVNLSINSVDDGIVTDGAITISDSTLSLTTDGDSIKANSTTIDEDATEWEKGDALIGSVTIGNSDLTLSAGADGISSDTDVTIDGGTYHISTGIDNDDEDASRKGIKAENLLTIVNGTIHIDGPDDSLHSDGSVTILDGDITLHTQDDGIHAEADLLIDNGTLTIAESYEGIEWLTITINNGLIDITSSDDGISTSDGSDAQEWWPGSMMWWPDGMNMDGDFTPPHWDENDGERPTPPDRDENNENMGPGMMREGAMWEDGERMWPPMMEAIEGIDLVINGGSVTIHSAKGDGVDSNGTFTINDGTVVIYGPEKNPEEPVDINGATAYHGGSIIGIGSAGMTKEWCTEDVTTQACMFVIFEETHPADTTITITDANGQVIIILASPQTYNSIVFSSSDLIVGEVYTIEVDGEVVETVTMDTRSVVIGSSQFTGKR